MALQHAHLHYARVTTGLHNINQPADKKDRGNNEEEHYCLQMLHSRRRLIDAGHGRQGWMMKCYVSGAWMDRIGWRNG